MLSVKSAMIVYQYIVDANLILCYELISRLPHFELSRLPPLYDTADI